jgi:hypothetical protein
LIIGENERADPASMLQQHHQLPLCQGSEHQGRWLPWPLLDNSKPATVSNYAQEKDISKIACITRDGKYWVPYTCRYRYLSYETFNRCANKKHVGGMNLYGDSNLRRCIKKFVSHGQWCKG